MRACRLCDQHAVEELMDVGPQPVCNRFLKNKDDKQYACPMTLGQCEACGLIQLTTEVPVSELLPPYDWITYSEPEGHLDSLADVICALPGVAKESVICGVSYKDDTLLRRLAERGIKNTWRIDPEADLGIRETGAGVETIQDRITPEAAAALAAARGKARIVVARHILEHAYSVYGLGDAFKQLLEPDGFLIL